MTAEARASDCPECGGHVSPTWRRTHGEDASCRRCSSRTERNRTLEHIGADLTAIRDADTVPYADADTPDEDEPAVRYRGAACCRYCRTYLHSGRMTLWHLPECRLDLVLRLLQNGDPPSRVSGG